MKPTKIYALIDPRNNEVRYVGKTVRSLSDRYRRHIHRALKEMPSLHVSRWIASLVNEGFKPSMIELESVPAGGDWAEAERRWIKHYLDEGIDLTNLTSGGDFGCIPNEATTRKLSIAMTGRTVSDEVRAKISEKNKGRKLTPEQIEKRALAQRGAKRTDEFRKMCADRQRSRKGKYKLSEEAIMERSDRLSGSGNPFFGKKHTEESKLSMSRARLGENRPDDVKRRISEKMKDVWRSRKESSLSK